jgi:hypothetical protein
MVEMAGQKQIPCGNDNQHAGMTTNRATADAEDKIAGMTTCHA